MCVCVCVYIYKSAVTSSEVTYTYGNHYYVFKPTWNTWHHLRKSRESKPRIKDWRTPPFRGQVEEEELTKDTENEGQIKQEEIKE